MWDKKYRPLKFSDVLGQQGTVAILKERLRNGSALDTSYIFVGGSGQGKTTLARILARAMLCDRLDPKDPEPCNECDNCRAFLEETSVAFVEQDAASNGTIENVRRIVDDLAFGVMGAKKRIYLFDEAHRMSSGAQDVLLKPLEEKKLVGMFATTEPEKIRGPIRTRCEEYQIRKVSRDEILERMKHVLSQEGVEGDDDAVATVIDFCGGHVRDVLNKMEMVAQMGRITMENVRSYLNLSVVSSYYEILLALPTDVGLAMALVEKACARVTPEEVVAGLAEAAMNSFRLAHKMFADFVYVDRSLAEKVYAQYREACIDLADFFTRSRYATQIGVVCDVLTLSRTISVQGDLRALTARPAVVMPPAIVINAATVISSAPAVESATSAVVPAPVQVTPPPVAAQAAPVAQTPAALPTPTAAPAAAKSTMPTGGRGDGIGNLGKDPLALTELDEKGVPREKPKQSVPTEKQQINFSEKTDADFDLITPDECRRYFEILWTVR